MSSDDDGRLNSLDGKTWTRYSISVWDDLRKTREEKSLDHPALFPSMLAERLLKIFTKPRDIVLDPFVGSGSTLVAAQKLNRDGVGIDINPDYVELTEKRLASSSPCPQEEGSFRLITGDALNLSAHVQPQSVDICITSPPYWDILTQRRTADGKDIRNYGDRSADLGTLSSYDDFLSQMARVFSGVYEALKTEKFCCVVLMDLRKKDQFYPLHMDLTAEMRRLGFTLDDIIIWDRRHEYSNLRPLGYPYVFRVNKVHEFIMLYQKRS